MSAGTAGPVPVIDLDGRHRVGADGIDGGWDPATVRAVDDAGAGIGFFAVIGHGVPATVIDAAFAAARTFFDLPLDDRLGVAMPEPGYPYGYSPLQGEALERSLGDARPDGDDSADDAGDPSADLKETFNIGPIDPPPRPLTEMTDPDERSVYAPNCWPDAVLPGFRPAMEAYYRAMAALSGRLMSLFAAALGRPDDFFEPFIDRHGSALRVAHYPALDHPPAPGQLRAGPHTDYGTLTVLATDGEPGLEVRTPGGEWAAVAPPDDALIINLGDLMARWSNDRWRSTLHRVVVPARPTRRLSLPFFHNANWDARITCLTTDGESARYPPVLAGQHLMSKFRATITDPAASLLDR